MEAMIPVDNKVALRQLRVANEDLVARNASRQATGKSLAKDGLFHPRVLTLVG
jgi:agmatinase